MKQQIIVLSGLPGSGKSTLAEALAHRLRLPLLSVDPIESAMVQAGIARSYQTGLAAYMVVRDLAAEQLRLGSSVIIDAVNAEEEAKDTWRSLAMQLEVPLTIVETRLNETEHQKRITGRVRNLPGLPEVQWADVCKRNAAYTAWREPVCVVDMATDLEDNLARVIDYANRR